MKGNSANDKTGSPGAKMANLTGSFLKPEQQWLGQIDTFIAAERPLRSQPMNLQRLVTIGYEGAVLADFLATLELANVDTLLDVREMAISRRKGFAKTALRNGLESVGIGYRHEPRLGSPKVIRHQLRADNDFPRFFRDFEQHLERQQALLKSLVDELHGTVALLCFERDHTQCHRRSVANALRDMTGIVPKHLGVQPHDQRKAVAHSRACVGESVSAA